MTVKPLGKWDLNITPIGLGFWAIGGDWAFGSRRTMMLNPSPIRRGVDGTGKIRHIGVSNFNVSQLKRVQMIAPVMSVQPPYSMLMRQIEDEILPFCQQHNIGIIGYAPMHNGLLSGTMTRERIAALPESDWRRNVNLAFREPQRRCEKTRRLSGATLDQETSYTGSYSDYLWVRVRLRRPVFMRRILLSFISFHRLDSDHDILLASDNSLTP